MTNEEINNQYGSHTLMTEREKNIAFHITAIGDLERYISNISDYASKFDLEQFQIELQSHRNELHKLTGLPHDIITYGKKTPDFVSLIGDLIHNYVNIREVPYQEGDRELDSASVDNAAYAILEMLKRNGFNQN